MSKFIPPYGLHREFDAFRKVVGDNAYRAWLGGAKAWVRPDDVLVIEVAASRATYVRLNFAEHLTEIVGKEVEVHGV